MAWAHLSSAAEVEIVFSNNNDGITELHLEGPIIDGDLVRLKKAHLEASSKLGFCGSDAGWVNCNVTFNSPGGSLFEGMAIGDGSQVQVVDQCAPGHDEREPVEDGEQPDEVEQHGLEREVVDVGSGLDSVA